MYNRCMGAVPRQDDARCQIFMLGSLRVVVNGHEIPSLRTRKTAGLLAFLAYHLGQPHSRDGLADLFWSNGDIHSGRQSLRTALTTLRSVLEPSAETSGTVLSTNSQSVCLRSQNVDTDSERFERRIAQAAQAESREAQLIELLGALEEVKGVLLPGFDDAWIIPQVLRLEENAATAATTASNILCDLGRWEEAVQVLNRLISIFPDREDLRVELMKAFHVAGRPDAVQKQYSELVDMLQRIWGLGPSTEAIAIAEAPLTREATSPTGGSALLDSSSTSRLSVMLMTDVVGSTKLWEHDPSAMRSALSMHDDIVGQLIRAHRGKWLKQRGEGDSVFALFLTAADAIEAAVEINTKFAAAQWPTSSPLKVRSAIHCGEADDVGNDLYGRSVNRTARLRAIAYPGQILVSEAAKMTAVDTLTEGVTLKHLGAVALRDLDRPEEVYQVAGPGLASEFPPLEASASRNNLPAPVNAFVGRDTEVEALRAALSKSRVISLVGAGGCGKTRLALHVAHLVLGDFGGGAWLVELAPLRDPRLLIQGIADVLGLKEDGTASWFDAAVAALDRPTLIILDNAEHVIQACAEVTEELTARCSHLRVLVTTQESLNIPAEAIVKIGPLPIPDSHTTWTNAAECASVALFENRARNVSQQFELSEANIGAVSDICRKLDGIPLAIELAAARVKVFTPHQIAERLSDRFKLLGTPNRHGVARHQTLEAMIEWSYDLLSPEERSCLSGLSVFNGSFSVEASCALLADDDVIDNVISLVEKSLVQVIEGQRENRYRLLESVRVYATARLSPEEEVRLRSAHLAYFCNMAEDAASKLTGAGQADALAALIQDHENLLAGLDWAEQHDLGGALALGGSLSRFWYLRGFLTEGQRRLELLIQRAGEHDSGVNLARCLGGAGILAWRRNHLIEAETYHRRALTTWQQMGDSKGQADSLSNLGLVAIGRNQFEEAARNLQESLAIRRELGDHFGAANSLNNLGILAWRNGKLSEAADYYAQCLEARRKVGDDIGETDTLHNLALIRQEQTEYAAARDLFGLAATRYQSLGNLASEAQALDNLGVVLLYLGEAREAREQIERSLALAIELGDEDLAAWSRFNLGLCDLTEGRLEAAEAAMMEATSRESTDGVLRPSALAALGAIALRRGDLDSAAKYFRQGDDLARERQLEFAPMPPVQEARRELLLGETRPIHP